MRQIFTLPIWYRFSIKLAAKIFRTQPELKFNVQNYKI